MNNLFRNGKSFQRNLFEGIFVLSLGAYIILMLFIVDSEIWTPNIRIPQEIQASEYIKECAKELSWTSDGIGRNKRIFGLVPVTQLVVLEIQGERIGEYALRLQEQFLIFPVGTRVEKCDVNCERTDVC
jgi:hypothetical protein